MGKIRLVAALAAVLAALAAVVALVGLRLVFLVSSIAVFVLYVNLDCLLGKLICWAIGCIPQAYRWSMDRVSVRPSLNERAAWSEIVVTNWTWHNPLGFEEDDARAPPFLLQIDTFTLRLKLSTIYGALFDHKAIEIDLMRAQGLRFHTRRNKRGALNLWQALDLPDDDVNVRSFTRQATKYGGLEDEGGADLEKAAPEVVPLPPVSTAATRAAAEYWRPEWGQRPPGNDALSPGSRASRNGAAAQTKPASELERPLLEKRYVEEPIGDPRRRPRWGVPVRFDIHRLQLTDVQLWVLDLMTLDAHKTAQHRDPDKVRIDVKTVCISRERLEAGDDRRSGSVDDIRGVYLGELVWVIVAELIPLILKRAPWAISRTAALAAGYAVKDMAKRLTAHAVEKAHAAGHALKEVVHHQRGGGGGGTPEHVGCRVQVHLIGGRQVTRKGYSVNAHALLELHSPDGRLVSEARSEPQMWTKAPHWDETFELGPAQSSTCTLRVTLYHRKSRQVVGITASPKEMPERFIGEVVLPLRMLLIKDAVIAQGGEIVGWFPLADSRGLRQGTPCTGDLKLGLRLLDPERLSDGDQVRVAHHTGAAGSHHDFAILH